MKGKIYLFVKYDKIPLEKFEELEIKELNKLFDDSFKKTLSEFKEFEPELKFKEDSFNEFGSKLQCISFKSKDTRMDLRNLCGSPAFDKVESIEIEYEN